MVVRGLSFARPDHEKGPVSYLQSRSCFLGGMCDAAGSPSVAVAAIRHQRPRAKWGEPMSIRCVCPNGHVLKVREALAGKTGLCPECRARVVVPRRPARDMSEDAILDILGPGSGVAGTDDTTSLQSTEDSWTGRDVREKHCYKCERLFPTTMHVCPYCHTYIANLHDFQ